MVFEGDVGVLDFLYCKNKADNQADINFNILFFKNNSTMYCIILFFAISLHRDR